MYIVPSPQVSVTISNNEEVSVLFAGGNVTLNCNVEMGISLPNSSVLVSLEGPKGILAIDTHDIDTNNNGATITTSVTLVSLAASDDSGIYTCRAVYSHQNYLPHVEFEEGSDSVQLTVIGNHKQIGSV